MSDLDVGRILAVWIAPDGDELLLLTDRRTTCWSLRDERASWTIREQAGGDGISPDGRLYRDLASGLFYPLLGSHGGRQVREHPAGGYITVDDKAGTVTVSDSDGSVHDLSREGGFGDWLVASFCESGDHIVVAGPRCLAVFRVSKK
ncbi:MAG: hypothetical protein KJO08_01890 [Gammaproteobacteria bacterium]|nr:hypothetical protein [Gammaproteobacteria bacterium]NNJ83812.1 hypothetical protein [Gammaproteobacteria bacterium]